MRYVLGLVYLGWCVFSDRPPTNTAGYFIPKPAVNATKTQYTRPITPRLLPKSAVVRKFPQAPITESEEWLDSADIPPAPNGATVLTKIDTVTGESTTEVEIKPAPWLAFERTNYLGIGAEIGTDGTKYKAYYKRDVFRVKDLHLQVEAGVRAGQQGAEAYAGVNAEWRF